MHFKFMEIIHIEFTSNFEVTKYVVLDGHTFLGLSTHKTIKMYPLSPSQKALKKGC